MADETIESQIIQALSCIYPNYHCIVFGGGFKYDDATSKPDLALVARDFLPALVEIISSGRLEFGVGSTRAARNRPEGPIDRGSCAGESL
jgi:hypothetical protein